MQQKIKESMNEKLEADSDFKGFIHYNHEKVFNGEGTKVPAQEDNDPQIFFLGTVSMKPSMYRNASAIYILLKGHGILMDCAEGSYSQLYDHFRSQEKVNEILIQTKLAFITHIHGDH